MSNTPKETKSFKEQAIEFLRSQASFLIFLAALLVFRTSIAAAYRIPSGSMIPTLKIGDVVGVSKLAYGLKAPIPFTNITLWHWDEPERGDIVVFQSIEDPSINLIKRLVGLPGDRLEMKHGSLYLNGRLAKLRLAKDLSVLGDVPLPTTPHGGYTRLYHEDLGTVVHHMLRLSPYDRDFGPITVPTGHYFFMGDNRDNSNDSRFFGFVPKKQIIGKAHVILMSLSKYDPALRLGRQFYIPGVRWERVGQMLR